MESFIDLVADGKMNVKPLITHRIPISEGEKAYELITGKRNEPFLGVLLEYPQTEETPVNHSVPVAKVTLKPADPDTRPNVGVLGAGNYANATFLPVMKESKERCVLKSIASGRGGKARHSAEKFGFEKVETDGKAILEDPEIADVVLLTPHMLHAGQSMEALLNGRTFTAKNRLQSIYTPLLRYAGVCWIILNSCIWSAITAGLLLWQKN